MFEDLQEYREELYSGKSDDEIFIIDMFNDMDFFANAMTISLATIKTYSGLGAMQDKEDLHNPGFKELRLEEVGDALWRTDWFRNKLQEYLKETLNRFRTYIKNNKEHNMQLHNKEILFPEPKENNGEELTTTENKPDARNDLNALTANFWRTFILECENHNVDPEKEWVRIRGRFNQFHHQGKGYKRKRPVKIDGRQNNKFVK